MPIKEAGRITIEADGQIFLRDWWFEGETGMLELHEEVMRRLQGAQEQMQQAMDMCKEWHRNADIQAEATDG